ncbi:MAG: hypothetical protein ABSG17_23580 [Spirochaetia bacterium]|jgi:hypothetical protein
MKTAAVGLAFLLAGLSAFGDFIPSPPNGIVELDGWTAIVVQLGSFDILAEVNGRLENQNLAFDYRAITVGGYYRPLPNLKIGAFYRLQAGVRHDDDWGLNSNPPPIWTWLGTTERFENELMLDASPRFLLDLLPGRSWVLMVKGRYVYNTYENQQSIVARPELTFFWLVDRQPFMDFSAAYEAWFPLNYGTTSIYESYPWLAVRYHVTPELLVELGASYKSTVWSSSALAASDGFIYSLTYSRWLLSLGVIYVLNP